MNEETHSSSLDARGLLVRTGNDRFYTQKHDI